MTLKAKLKAAKERLVPYVVARAQESSTWRGFAIALTAMGATLSDEYKEAIITGGLFISGAVGVLFPDAVKKKEGE